MARINNITFACENPIPLSEFWAAAADYIPVEVLCLVRRICA